LSQGASQSSFQWCCCRHGTDTLRRLPRRNSREICRSYHGSVHEQIKIDDPRTPDVRTLLRLHLAHMQSQSPPENVFALDVSGRRRAASTQVMATPGAGSATRSSSKEAGRVRRNVLPWPGVEHTVRDPSNS